MNITLTTGDKKFRVDLNAPIDISAPLHVNHHPICYWSDPLTIETIRAEGFIGSVEAGGSVNHRKITITPHGNGTHTECYGHIAADPLATINSVLPSFHFIARLITVEPRQHDGDWVINRNDLAMLKQQDNVTAIVLRTLPNTPDKLTKNYSGTNPAYIKMEAIYHLVACGIDHLLIDLPSVDRESDGGKLEAHKAFWQYPQNIRKHATITELVFVPDFVPDGLYLLNLQIISLESDASPSKPILYKLKEVS